MNASAYQMSVKIRVFFYRAMLCIRGISHGPVSVSVCVCLSQVEVLLKRLNELSYPADEKSSLEGPWSGSGDRFRNLHPM